MIRRLLSLVALCGAAACAAPPPAADPFAEMRRTTFTYDILGRDARPDDPGSRLFVVEPGGRARFTSRSPFSGRVIERSTTLSAQSYERFLIAVARAIHADARPVRPDAITPANSSVARLTIERGELRMTIAGPVQARWRTELAEVDRVFWAARRLDARELAPDEARDGFWHVGLSPPFPLVWPIPAEGGSAVRYVYAMRNALFAGFEFSAVFARVVEGPDATLRVEEIGPFRVSHTVGLGRATPWQVALRNRHWSVEDLLFAPLAPEDEVAVRQVSCEWLLNAGPMRDQVATRHAEFVAWLNCPPWMPWQEAPPGAPW